MKTLPFLILPALLFAGCTDLNGDDAIAGGDEKEPTHYIAESAMAEIGSIASATEGRTLLDPTGVGTCSFATTRSGCEAGTDASFLTTITWNKCTIGSSTLSGEWEEKWSPTLCTLGSQPGALTDGTGYARRSTGQVVNLSSGAMIKTDTYTHKTYTGDTLPNNILNATGVSVDMAGGTRTIEIWAIRKKMYGPYGSEWFDHSFIASGITVTGALATSDRIANGQMTIYNNFIEYTAIHTFNSVKWGTPTCCYPTSGSITSTLSGNRSGNTNLTFSTTCGVASFQDTDSSIEDVILTMCH